MKKIKKFIIWAEKFSEEGRFKSLTIPLHRKPIPQEDDNGI